MRYLMLFVMLMATLITVKAAPDSKSKLEIDHLLTYIKNSEVVFIRNGKEYPVADGLKHIQKKFDHFNDKIITSEDFIEKSATKSEISGSAYFVKLKDNSKIECSKWLLTELKKYRENRIEKNEAK